MDRTTPVFETKADWVVAELRAAVRTGRLAPGERVRIGDWAQRLGVSETPMREAVKVLAAEGAFTIEPHKGARVTSFTSEDFLEFCRVLGTLEGIAVRLAAEKLDHDQRAAVARRLRRVLDELETAMDRQDLAHWVQLNRTFHAYFDELANSLILKSAISPLRDMFPVADTGLGEVVLASPSARTDLLREYEAVLTSFEAGDADGAATAMGRHVTWILSMLKDVHSTVSDAGANPLLPV